MQGKGRKNDSKAGGGNVRIRQRICHRNQLWGEGRDGSIVKKVFSRTGKRNKSEKKASQRDEKERKEGGLPKNTWSIKMDKRAGDTGEKA